MRIRRNELSTYCVYRYVVAATTDNSANRTNTNTSV